MKRFDKNCSGAIYRTNNMYHINAPATKIINPINAINPTNAINAINAKKRDF